jgi:hypothetical protein
MKQGNMYEFKKWKCAGNLTPQKLGNGEIYIYIYILKQGNMYEFKKWKCAGNLTPQKLGNGEIYIDIYFMNNTLY